MYDFTWMRKSAGRSSPSGAALLPRRIRQILISEAYIRYFGEDYQPPDYLRQAYAGTSAQMVMTARLITVNDVYDPHVVVDIDDFEDVIGKHFRQPEEGLGFDGSPVAHLWRTMIWPRKSLERQAIGVPADGRCRPWP